MALEAAGALAAHINHDDRFPVHPTMTQRSQFLLFCFRHFGSIYCAIKGLTGDDISRLGGWTQNKVQMKCYERILAMKSIVKLSGFDRIHSFFLERAVIDPLSVDDSEIVEFASGIFGELDDASFREAVLKVLYQSVSLVLFTWTFCRCRSRSKEANVVMLQASTAPRRYGSCVESFCRTCLSSRKDTRT